MADSLGLANVQLCSRLNYEQRMYLEETASMPPGGSLCTLWLAAPVSSNVRRE